MAYFLAGVLGATLLPMGVIEAIVKGVRGENNAVYLVIAMLSGLAVFIFIFAP